MPYANIVFAKLEKRILNDPRWFMLGESAQLNYIRLILAACETYNRIPRNPAALKKMFRTELTEEQITSDLLEITKSFPKLRENGEFYFFEDFHEKTNYIPKEIQRKSQGNPKDGAEEEEEEEKKKKKNKIEGQKPPSTTVSKNRKDTAAYDMFLAKYKEVCRVEYIPQWGKDYKLLKSVLPHIKSSDHWGQILANYFSDSYAQNTGFGFGLLVSQINKYNKEVAHEHV